MVLDHCDQLCITDSIDYSVTCIFTNVSIDLARIQNLTSIYSDNTGSFILLLLI